ncbi:WhiB family transcriptional regulator [Streptomyces sp. NPDC014806]|uniref:WhiB family transcriptional regulator n=1 Tax=Streptomyces sp. NPDC014806 TaxID=3364920 RepID=UPI003700B316
MSTVTLPNRLAWAERAACRGYDLDLFFSESDYNVDAAKRICAGCPVRTECLDEQLRNEDGSRYGIYGGLTPRERSQLVRVSTGRKVAPCGTHSAYNRHVKKKEPIDEACRAAKREAERKRRRVASAKPQST